ncbi:hypothetical protein [Nonomuraea lactucae]|uniref:hypothetical protein n=1 Tax=Nonomuraea lactucae TaxID=2249762 RepID=UPI000DE4C426|nr:hypothetical protein [Nonomuraea lactucae]
MTSTDDRMTPEELAAWQARKDAGRATAKSIEVQVAAAMAANPEVIDGFRLFCARMDVYSIRNAMRIFGQNPKATHVQPRFFWGGYGRAIAEPEAAIWIMAPKVERKHTKEVESPKTGEAETVEESYKFWPVEEVFPASATVPKNGPCPFCDTGEGQLCPDTCPVMQPQDGRIPSREDVTEALRKVLKQIGGFDASVLAALGDDPLGEYSDGVTWGTVTLTKGAAQGRKPKTRRYRFVHTVDMSRPGVRYAIAGLGVIWIGPYELAREGEPALQVQYGDNVTRAWELSHAHTWDSSRTVAGPHAPILNGVEFASTSIIYPTTSWDYFSPWRAGRARVPETTAQQMGQIVRQLLEHYHALPEADELDKEGARRRARRRAREAQEEVNRLAEQEARLASQRAGAEQRVAENRALAEQ